jgi:uncharacterized protein YndB with AHSA1/START domain
MSRTIQIAPVRKSVLVEASAAIAFEVFTAQIDRWWPKTHHIGRAPPRRSTIEPFAGGRWYTQHEDGEEIVLGHVSVWQPPERLIVSWEISADWKPAAGAAFASEVDIRFTAVTDEQTRVDLEHRNFERVPGGEKMRNDVDRGWPGVLELFAKAVSDR